MDIAEDIWDLLDIGDQMGELNVKLNISLNMLSTVEDILHFGVHHATMIQDLMLVRPHLQRSHRSAQGGQSASLLGRYDQSGISSSLL